MRSIQGVWALSFVCAIAGLACGGGERPPVDLDSGMHPLIDSGTTRPDAGPCHGVSDCNDGVDCTTDACSTTSGVCTHVVTPALCHAGESCSATHGCVAGHACATSTDCTDTDACTTGEHCDPASRVCLFSALDGDHDGDPPRVCGGMDCDDGNPLVNSAATEDCNGIDDDCDARIDEMASTACGTGASCVDGHCQCAPSQSYCGGHCIDTSHDDANCGGCGMFCSASSHCQSSRCRCADGRLSCFGTCVDEQTDPNSCGDCNTFCSGSQSCVAGHCTCASPAMMCGSSCLDVTTDDANCGTCGHACGVGQACVGSTCVACGAANGACCHGFPECTSGGVCFSDVCQPCGMTGQICCVVGSSLTCLAGSVCNTASAMCEACGGTGQPCCGTTCNTGLSCTSGTCRAPTCSTATGVEGGHCRAGVCNTGAGTCFGDLSTMSVDTVFGGIREGTPADASHPGYQGLRATYTALEDPPFHGWVGSMCGLECDLDAAVDGCGTCGTCSRMLSQVPIVDAFGGARVAYTAPRFTNSGQCRIPCTFDPTTRGMCPTQETCAAFDEVCIEECTSSAECNMTYGVTYAGELVSVINATGALTCNTTTGRCQSTGVATAHVGDVCASSNDCAPGFGTCLNGGRCGLLGCTTPGATCDAGRGVCLALNENQNLCIRGCAAIADCGGRNSCAPLGTTIGGFTGYCIGTCAADTDCAATETCTDGGGCVPRCATPGAVGVAAGCATAQEFCRADHAGATYGYCLPIDDFCGANNTTNLPAASADCATGYVCDELLATGGGVSVRGRDSFGDGHCVRACAGNPDCTVAGTTCVTSGIYAGLCRRQGCSATITCPTGQMCDVARAVCVENPPPP